jgi:hypothetical protein
MRYLNGKETVRKRAFGRERWNDCMTFLSQVMPRDKFEEYCRKVNEKRGVSVGHKDHVSPESFYPAGTTIQDVIDDSRERIGRGGTCRDFARIIACDSIRDNFGDQAGKPECGTAEEKTDLCNKTEDILKDPRFENFIGNMTEQERLDMINESPEILRAAWISHKESNSLQAEEKTAEKPENEEYLPESVSSPMPD